jgi:hypothetical protein
MPGIEHTNLKLKTSALEIKIMVILDMMWCILVDKYFSDKPAPPIFQVFGD